MDEILRQDEALSHVSDEERAELQNRILDDRQKIYLAQVIANAPMSYLHLLMTSTHELFADRDLPLTQHDLPHKKNHADWFLILDYQYHILTPKFEEDKDNLSVLSEKPIFFSTIAKLSSGSLRSVLIITINANQVYFPSFMSQIPSRASFFPLCS